MKTRVLSIAVCLLMITSISAPITQNVGQPQNIVQPTSSSGETWDPLDSSRPTYPQNSYKPVLSQKETNDVNPISLGSSSSLSTWMVWIESLDSDKYEYNLTEPIMIDVELKRGNDMLTVVWVGALILEVFNSAMIQVYNESNVVWLAHGGAVTYYSYNFNLNETGKHLVRATLTWTDGTVTDVKEIEINIIEEQQNQPPIADAGPDQTVNEGDVVEFDGSGGMDEGREGPWDIQIVDSHFNVGRFSSIALDSNDNPHISYLQYNWGNLTYAKWTETNWSIETVDPANHSAWIGRFSSIAIDSFDNPQISYYDGVNADLKYAKWNGTNWTVEVVDSDGTVGRYTSIVLDSDDRPHISYTDGTNTNLKYAKWTGTNWSIEVVDSHWGMFTSIALDINGNPHISYFDRFNENLKYAKRMNGSWAIETVDSNEFVGRYTSIALDIYGHPHISYTDETNDDLKYTKWDGTKWNIETIDSDGFVGFYTSLSLDKNNKPHISYYDGTNRNLKYANFIENKWNIMSVDMEGYVGEFTSLALDNNDYPHISYYDSFPNKDLKYAKWIGYKNRGQIISYEWDFESDGIYDYVESIDNAPDGVFDGKTSHTYGDEGFFIVTLRVTDDQNLTDTDTCNITVLNVDPTVTIESIKMEVEIGLRVAGRKYNNVSMTLFENGNSLGNVSIERNPGFPDEQMAWIPASINFSKSYSATVTYTPEDPPNVGGNPVWIYIKSKNGTMNKIHRTFNVQQSKKRDSDHWNHVEPWKVDLNAHFIGLPFEITSHIIDPGSDDEILTFTYGSQIKTVAYLNNPPTPDPYPSPEVNPRDIMDTTTLVYEGPGTVMVTVEDDDRGLRVVTLDIG